MGQEALSTRQCEMCECMNVHINANWACVECKNVKKRKKNVNVCIVAVTVSPHSLAVMCRYLGDL